MAATLSLGQAIVGLQIQMRNGIGRNTQVKLSDGISAILNSWPEQKKRFHPGRIRLEFPGETFVGQGTKPCYLVVVQDPEDSGSYLYIGWPRFLDIDDPDVGDAIDSAIVELAERMDIAQAEAA